MLIKFGDVIYADDKMIPCVKDENSLKKTVDYLQTGDVIFADTAEDDSVGKATEILNPNNTAVVSGLHTIPCRPNYAFVPSYLGYYMNSKAFHDQLYPFMQGIKVTSISKGNIGKTVISYPHLSEQKKIADLLMLLSERIEKQRLLVEALKSYKRGVLSSIFDEDSVLRKKGKSKWKCHKISDFLSPRIMKQIPSLEAPLMAFTAEGGVCQKGERYDRSFLVKDENKQYKRTEYNDFIYSSNNLDVGSIGLNKYGTAVISDVYEIFSIHDAVPTFISEAIQRKRTLQNILKFRQGVIYGQYRIYAEDFLSVEINLPDYEEQTEYATLIAAIDDKISQESSLQSCLEKYKSGLLQQMFI